MVFLALGIGPALLAMTCQAFVGVLANHILTAEGTGWTYQSTLRNKVAPWAGHCVAAAVIANGLTKLVVWLIVLTDIILGHRPAYTGLLPDIMRAKGLKFHHHAFYANRWVWVLFLGTISLPAVSVRSLNSIAWVSSIGGLGVFYMSFAGAALAALAGVKHIAWPLAWLPHVHGGTWLKPLSMLSVLLSSTFNQHSILSVATQLEPFTQNSLDKASTITNATIVVLKAMLAISNLALFGSHVKSDVLLNYTQHSLHRYIGSQSALIMASSVKVAFLVNGVISFPLYLWPMQSNFWAVLYGEKASEQYMKRRLTYITFNFTAVSLAMAIATVVTDIHAPLAIIGATAIGWMAFFAPALLVLQQGNRWGRNWRWLAWLMVFVGSTQGLFGIAYLMVH
jgi:amino acid permease